MAHTDGTVDVYLQPNASFGVPADESAPMIMIGPGTGTFLVIALVSVLGYAFLPASALAKITNFATNAGALILFIPHGAVLWLLGLILGVANTAGSYLGSRMAISRGSGFIRVVFLAVVIVLIAKLGVDVWNENVAPLLAAR